MTERPARDRFEALRIRLESQLEAALPVVLGAAPTAAIGERPAPGKWSALQNLAHLGRHHEVFLDRVERVLREERPELPPYRAEDDAEWPAWDALGVEEVLGRLWDLRRRLVERFSRLSPAELGRTAVHSRFGEMTLLEWTEFFLVHEAHHLYVALSRLGEARRGPGPADPGAPRS